MFKKFFLLFLFLGVSSTAVADTVELDPDRPEQYIVKKGDTLWDISGRFLKAPEDWPKIWEGNPQIENPHLIYPDDIVRLIYRDGQLVLTVNGTQDEEGLPAKVVETEDRYVKLSPEIRYIERKHEQSVPLSIIQKFSRHAMIVSEKEMINWPYVVSSFNEHLISGKGNKLYIRGLSDKNQGIKHYSVYRKGEAYTKPNGPPDDILGYEALYIGEVVVEKRGDPGSAIVVSVDQEILNGDRLVPRDDESTLNNVVLSAPEHDIDANIINVIDGVAEIGRYQTVVVDVGHDDVRIGDVLGIYQDGRIVTDKVATEIARKKKKNQSIVVENEDKSAFNKELSELINGIRTLRADFHGSDLMKYLGQPQSEIQQVELPSERVGMVLVFRVFQRLSYALVIQVDGPVRVLDNVSNL